MWAPYLSMQDTEDQSLSNDSRRCSTTGTMSLAALKALIAGVRVRCDVVEWDRHGRLVAKVFSPNGVDIGRRLVSAGDGVPAVLDGLSRRGGAESQARDVAGHLRQALGVAGDSIAVALTCTRSSSKRHRRGGLLGRPRPIIGRAEDRDAAAPRQGPLDDLASNRDTTVRALKARLLTPKDRTSEDALTGAAALPLCARRTVTGWQRHAR
jgi:hypothetical protein